MDPQKEKKIRRRDAFRVAFVFFVPIMAAAFVVYFSLVAVGRLPLPRWPQAEETAPAAATLLPVEETEVAAETPAETERPAPTAERAPAAATLLPVEETEVAAETPAETVRPSPTAERTPAVTEGPKRSEKTTAEETGAAPAAELQPQEGGEEKAESIPPDLQSVGEVYWPLQLANRQYPLPEDYTPEELVYIESGQYVDRRIEAPVYELFAAARAAGYSLYFCSGYRDYDTQSIIYWNHIYDYQAQGMSFEEADELTCLSVQRPGCSEHQLGLTVDVLEYAGQDMLPYIGGTGLMAWLEKNCAQYGFIIRYPEDKREITGVDYEPWHLRYVGRSAEYITENGLCLEEYLSLCLDEKGRVSLPRDGGGMSEESGEKGSAGKK